MEEKQNWKYVFGPVNSRRLGRSLGLDVTPFKTCTYDCVYCQLGHTTLKTCEKKEYVPMNDVLAEILKKSESGMRPDFITFAGSGEPALYSRLGELIAEIKKMTSIPVAVITNGSLLHIAAVRVAMLDADLVVPSLDAWNEPVFQYINKPVEGLTFQKMLEGIIEFRNVFKHRFWLEIFLLGNYPPELATKKAEEVEAVECVTDPVLREGIAEFKKLITMVRPDKVQLNTTARPTAENVTGLPLEKMHCIAEWLKSSGYEVEAIGGATAPSSAAAVKVSSDDVYNLLLRHPSSAENLAEGLGASTEDVKQRLQELLQTCRIGAKERDGSIFYYCKTENRLK